MQQGFPAPAHAHPPGAQLLFDFGQPGAERLDADGLGVPSGGGWVPAYPPGPLPRHHRQPGLDPLDAGQQGAALGQQVAVGQLVGVLARAGQRPGPAGGRLRGQLLLTHLPRPRPLLRIEPAFRAPGCQVARRQRTQVLAHLAQHGSVDAGHPQPGPYPCACRRRDHERSGDLPQRAHTAPPEVWSFTALGPMSCWAQPRAFNARFRADRRP